MDELDKYFFVSYVNRYTKYFNRLLEINDYPEEYRLTPNEILSALYYYNDFNDEEMKTILNLIYVDEGSNINREVKEGVKGFLYKTWILYNMVKPYNDDYYRYMVVRQNNYDGLLETDYDELKDYIGKVYLMKKYGKKYECYDETLEELTTKHADLSSPYFGFLCDIGLLDVIFDTKHADYFLYKRSLNDVYKEFFASSINHHYEGEGLLDNKPKPKTYIYCTDAKNMIDND